ncbi:MAG: NADP-specific glutamate dehydrogenase [Pseudomonadota bacterium]|nr:NADP-specific glutamate dehydrogenase [Pseudomonadota bacterium]
MTTVSRTKKPMMDTSKLIGQDEFKQAVEEVMHDVLPWIEQNPKYQHPSLIDYFLIPNRIISFKISWTDDQGCTQFNTGYRVQNTNLLGPYKGGLRFSPTVNINVLKFLAFEQAFKNSLTGLSLGAGKGGSDFNPKGKSNNEIKSFCKSFISQLSPYIGHDIDVPAGDIGVGATEINHMIHHLLNYTDHKPGVLTGKPLELNGSHLRPEATGYGCVYFLQHMLATRKQTLKHKTVLISGAGNVALYAAEKCLELGAHVLTLSDSQGTAHFPDGLSQIMLDHIKTQRFNHKSRLSIIIPNMSNAYYIQHKKPWGYKGDCALPCATENELNEMDAKQLCQQGLLALSEGANMPATKAAIDIFKQAKILYGPGKAANAGGVAVSGFEMIQNQQQTQWSKEQVDAKLQEVMQHIHTTCLRYGKESPHYIDYAKGANIGGFVRIADKLFDDGYLG